MLQFFRQTFVGPDQIKIIEYHLTPNISLTIREAVIIDMLLPSGHIFAKESPAYPLYASKTFSKHSITYLICLQIIIVESGNINSNQSTLYCIFIIMQIPPLNFQIILLRYMKTMILVLFVISLWVCSAQDMDLSSIPQKEIKDLEDALRFSKIRAQSQEKNAFNSGFFNQLLNQQPTNNKKQSINEGSKISDMIKELPYQVLLPRRRNSPLDLFSNLFRQKNKETVDQVKSEEEESNPLDQLNQLIKKKAKKGKTVYWENPDFKEGEKEIPFTKIFGTKTRVNRDLYIDQNLIEILLVESMPNLKGGHIIKLSSVPYRKGIYLHIEYQTEKNQFYTIKAKYRRRNSQLEIISLNQINIPKTQEETSSEIYQAENKETYKELQEKEQEKLFKPVQVQQIKEVPAQVQLVQKKVEEKPKEKLADTKQVKKQETKKGSDTSEEVKSQKIDTASVQKKAEKQPMQQKQIKKENDAQVKVQPKQQPKKEVKQKEIAKADSKQSTKKAESSTSIQKPPKQFSNLTQQLQQREEQNQPSVKKEKAIQSN